MLLILSQFTPSLQSAVANPFSETVIKSNGYRVSIIEVEMHLLRLPFIADACVLPVTDATSNERVAAIIHLQQDLGNMPDRASFPKPDGPWLEFVRDQLSATLPTHMMPTALRVLRDGEDIPRTDSMKVLRRKAAEQYFALSSRLELPTDVERCDVGY
jgi:malonyl-CoA/methylmalonyl-CoA synthetase